MPNDEIVNYSTYRWDEENNKKNPTKQNNNNKTPKHQTNPWQYIVMIWTVYSQHKGYDNFST